MVVQADVHSYTQVNLYYNFFLYSNKSHLSILNIIEKQKGAFCSLSLQSIQMLE